jgi:AcrR family transcriptional regulator
MSALARTVGISRQALYLHFPDRAQLLLALVADIDEKEQLQAGRAAVREAPTLPGRSAPGRGCVPKDGSTRPGPPPRRPPCCGS